MHYPSAFDIMLGQECPATRYYIVRTMSEGQEEDAPTSPYSSKGGHSGPQRPTINHEQVQKWGKANQNLYSVLYLSYTGPAASPLRKFVPKIGYDEAATHANGIAISGTVTKYESDDKQ